MRFTQFAMLHIGIYQRKSTSLQSHLTLPLAATFQGVITMLRDGQFLSEPPVKIGAHYHRWARHHMNSTELFMQDVLLGDSPKKKRSGYEWLAIVVGCYVLIALLAGLIQNFN